MRFHGVRIGLATSFATVIALLVMPTATMAADSNDLHRAREGTEAFHSLSKARAAGYSLFKDAAGIACIDKPGVGGMGVHYVNGSLVGKMVVDAARPEALVYEPEGRWQAAPGGARVHSVRCGLAERWEHYRSNPFRALVRVGQKPQSIRARPLLRAARLGLEAQPARHVRRLEPKGELLGRLSRRSPIDPGMGLAAGRAHTIAERKWRPDGSNLVCNDSLGVIPQ